MPSPLDRLQWSSSAARLVRRGRFVVAGLCLLLAAVTALGAARTTAEPVTAGQMHTVLVAVRDLPAGTVLRRTDLAARSWPAVLPPDVLPAGLRAVVGRRVAGPVSRGEPLTTSRLAAGELTAGLRSGTVATSLALAAGYGGFVQPGDHVDVISTAAAPDPLVGSIAPGKAGPAQVVARRALVLAVYPDAEGAGGTVTRVVVATSRQLAVRMAGLAAGYGFTVVVDSS